MRPLVAGIALVCPGIFLLVRGGSLTTPKEVVKIGDVKLTADEKQSIPPWVAYRRRGAIAPRGGRALPGSNPRRAAWRAVPGVGTPGSGDTP